MISLCIIAKNSEKIIKQCIDSASKIAEEIIVVDTGSTDSTKKTAESLGAKVYDFKWINDFSKARNFAISLAKEEWILNLDTDETISFLDTDKIKNLIKDTRYLGYYLIQRNYTNRIGDFNFISCHDDKYEESKIANGYIPKKIVRLFKNNPRIISEGVIHDSVILSIERIGINLIGDTNIPIHHSGFLNRNPEKDRGYIDIEKRNIKNDFFQEYQIASQLHSLGELNEALEHLTKSLSLNSSFYLSYLEIAIISIKKGKIKEAKPLLIESLRLKESEMAWDHLGIVEVYENNFNRAIECFKKAISINPKNADFHFNLAQTLEKIKNTEDADKEFNIALKLNPSYKDKIENIKIEKEE